ncbi:LA_3696 family protein [Leptonema illini]|uniref:Apolipoprotein A1/A4/E n=1 Tax=Leptonema illini DSM 21528 TaxID=929563 RepID=H2CJE8_9LEPT|nr:hypothetical protein [Leptonema illini]EHQ07105.1 hypothetical protein Lepil_2430 [Leptonema illini DSM 21528]PKL34437.1 MAG: hypothetical protein CVV45_03125 [Spirochaetae bacterium HGW-Spirochaetae-10]
MPHFIQLPEEVASVFGPAATKFVDFLTSTFSLQKDEVVRMSALSFEKTVKDETTGLRLEMNELQAETQASIAELRAETQTSIAELRVEMTELRAETRASIAGLRVEMAELRAETQASIGELRVEMTELRAETQTSIAELRAEMKADFADVQKQIAGLHREITAQTRWFLAGLLAAATLYPIISQLLQRFL